MHPARRALEELKDQHEATMARVKAWLPAVFGIPIDSVPNAEWNHDNGVIYGDLVSEGVTYKFSFGNGVKELSPADE